MHRLNLLPKEILKARKDKKFKLISIFMLTTILMGSIFFYQWLNSKIKQTTREIEKTIERSSMPVLQCEEKIDVYLKKQQAIISIYEHLGEDNYAWSKLINKIISNIPKKTILTSLSINEEGQLKLKGTSPKTTYIGALLKCLEQIEDIEKVNLDFISHDNSIYIYGISTFVK